jgi:hypothetical protein
MDSTGPVVFAKFGMFNVEGLICKSKATSRTLPKLVPSTVKIKMQAIWPINIIAPRIPLIQVDTSKIDCPQ